MAFWKKENEGVEVALAVMEELSLGGFADPKYKAKAQEIIKKYKSQGKIAAAAAELCGEPTDSRALYIKSWAYSWAGAAHRKDTIKWTLKWLDTGCAHSDDDTSYYSNCTPLQSRFVKAYERLADAYEGEYLFEEAINARKKSLQIDQTRIHNYIGISGLLTKLNRIDDGISVLKSAQITDVSDIRLIRCHIAELEEKKARGYVYKPRKKKA